MELVRKRTSDIQDLEDAEKANQIGVEEDSARPKRELGGSGSLLEISK